MKAWCIWCEDGENYPKSFAKNNMLWIHEKCFNEITDMRSKIDGVREFMEGKRPYKNRSDYETVEKFLSEMGSFAKRFDNSAALIKSLRLNEK
jgi:hypothetical protein